jgi:hypothetical protein
MLGFGMRPDVMGNVVPSPRTGLSAPAWRCAIGMGFAVVRDCLRQDGCAPETLQASLDRELAEPSAGYCSAEIAMIRSEWPELGSLLGKSIDVLRPPPGTNPNATAKLASNVLFELAKRHVDEADRRIIANGQTIVNAIFDKDYLAASIAAASLLVGEIDKHCEGAARCDALNVTAPQMKRGVALLNGFISYASTYREGARDGEATKSDAEREKLRHDERKKAMDSLIDSATDRSNRRNRPLWSAGVGVGVGLNWRYARGAGLGANADQSGVLFVPQLALPTGIALDYFGEFVGFHMHGAVFDLGQYVAVDSDTGGLTKPTVGTAVAPALNLGIMFGSPRTPVLLSTQLGYGPGFKPDDFTPPCAQSVPAAPCPGPIERQAGGAFFGFHVGTYVPFIDFN